MSLLPTLFGIGQAGLGIFQAGASYQAQQQDYLNQTAFQDANNRFAAWQAGFNARAQDANAQYKYWTETVNHNQQLSYTHALRNLELMRAAKQADVVAETRAAAGASFVRDSEAISQSFQEASMQEAVALQQYQWRALQGRASTQAMGREGRSVDRLVNDYARQMGDFMTLQKINQGIRGRQYTREQAGQVAQYLNRWNSQQFYEEQPYIDPLPPFAPLPTLITPPPPSMRGSGPSSAAAALNIGSAVMGGISTGVSFAGKLDALRIPSGSTGPGTSNTRLAFSGINLLGS
jgi:hypothetical protein